VRTKVGLDAIWDFCSTCPVDTLIELQAPDGDSPFGNFMSFNPFPQSDNLVRVPMPSNGFGNAWGGGAKVAKSSKYNLILKPTGVGLPLDHIDPRLEIDDHGLAPWLERILFVILGLVLGGFIMFMRRKRA